MVQGSQEDSVVSNDQKDTPSSAWHMALFIGKISSTTKSRKKRDQNQPGQMKHLSENPYINKANGNRVC